MTLSENGFDLLSGMLHLDPAQRLSAKDALNHPYFTEVPLPCSQDQIPVFKEGGP